MTVQARPAPRPSPALFELRSAVTNVALVLGLAGVAAVALAALFGPQLAGHDPLAQKVVVFYPDGDYAVPPTPPSLFYPLGTDPLGRDILSRLLWGARLTLAAVLLAVAVRVTVGVTLGALAAWRRGVVDGLVVRVAEAAAGLPQLMLALLIAVGLRDLGLVGFVVALAAVGWPELALFVRAGSARLLASRYVEAARAIGVRERRVLFSHVARGLAPQLLGLTALEVGAALILLAELGFIGLFISGGTFFTTDTGAPVLPVRDRAPEWGQMLAGARSYAYAQQWVAYVPALVVVAAVVSFNLLAEGLRAALDPFGRYRLSPRTLGVAGRVSAVVLVVSAAGAAFATLRSTDIAFGQGLELARAAAARELPGGELVSSVVRFRSSAHALARPEKLNFYFARPGETTLLRVGFVRADANAMEVKHFDNEDDVEPAALRTLSVSLVPWEDALSVAERNGGLAYRTNSREYIVRVQLQDEAGGPTWKVRYGQPTSQRVAFEVVVDAETGTLGARIDRIRAAAEARAQSEIGGAVELVGMLVQFSNFGSGGEVADHPPTAVTFTFTARDARRHVVLGYDLLAPAPPFVLPAPRLAVGEFVRTVVAAGGIVVLRPGELTLNALLLERTPSPQEIFALVERSGGREARASTGQGGPVAVEILFVTRRADPVAILTYDGRGRTHGPPSTFVVDLRSGSVRRE